MTFSLKLEQYLERYLQDLELKQIFKDIIGFDDSNKVFHLIYQLINEHLKTSIEDILFIESSIGVVFGFILSNHQKIVLKIYSPKIPETYLKKMNGVQNLFYKQDFPAPKVLSPIFKFNQTHAGLYELIEGQKENGHQFIIRSQLAKALANFSAIVDKFQLMPLQNIFQQANDRKLWPMPHNALFNLKKSANGAGWIAKKALSARKLLNKINLQKKLAHTDWGTKNAIFQQGKLKGIFDWDSLGTMNELEMLGRAAAQFTADWGSGFKITPTPDEAREFVKSYEEYRKCKFTPDELKIISASADYLIAIIARFEHAGGSLSIHPYQDLLKECGEKSFLFV